MSYLHGGSLKTTRTVPLRIKIPNSNALNWMKWFDDKLHTLYLNNYCLIVHKPDLPAPRKVVISSFHSFLLKPAKLKYERKIKEFLLCSWVYFLRLYFFTYKLHQISLSKVRFSQFFKTHLKSLNSTKQVFF